MLRVVLGSLLQERPAFATKHLCRALRLVIEDFFDWWARTLSRGPRVLHVPGFSFSRLVQRSKWLTTVKIIRTMARRGLVRRLPRDQRALSFVSAEARGLIA